MLSYHIIYRIISCEAAKVSPRRPLTCGEDGSADGPSSLLLTLLASHIL